MPTLDSALQSPFAMEIHRIEEGHNPTFVSDVVLRKGVLMTDQSDWVRFCFGVQHPLELRANNVPNLIVGPIEDVGLKRASNKRRQKHAPVRSPPREKRRTEDRSQHMQSFLSRHQEAKTAQRLFQTMLR